MVTSGVEVCGRSWGREGDRSTRGRRLTETSMHCCTQHVLTIPHKPSMCVLRAKTSVSLKLITTKQFNISAGVLHEDVLAKSSFLS